MVVGTQCKIKLLSRLAFMLLAGDSSSCTLEGIVVIMAGTAIIVAVLKKVVYGLWPLMPCIIVPSVAAALLWLAWLGYRDEWI
jgi:hypothetical protein